MPESTIRLSTAQVAARLRIKPTTLYAYVSRGLLDSIRGENGGSTFDPIDVEAFASSRGRGSRATAGRAGRPLMVLDSDLTLLENDELYFRGVAAPDLAHRLQFEDAVAHLWNSRDTRDDLDSRFASRTDVVGSIRRATVQLGAPARLLDRAKLAVLIVGSHDPVRDSLAPAAVRDAGRQILATMVDSLPDRGSRRMDSDALAARLWSKLSPREPSTADLGLLNSAMILCLDHDLAISTMAARVSASARANPYSAISAALNTLDGSMHGAASVAAVAMLHDTLESGNAERAISTQLARFGIIPGFGHILYRASDPRAQFLFSAMAGVPEYRRALNAVDRLNAVVQTRSPRPANLDLALAALVVGAEMSNDAGEFVFAVSRAAGWISHILSEYDEPAMRLRPESRYTGPMPARG